MKLPFVQQKGPAVLRKKPKPRELTLLQKQSIIGFIIALCIALLVTGIYFGTRIASLQITEVQVVGGETIPHSELVSVVTVALDGTYFKLVPKRFRPLYPHDLIVSKIKANNRIKNVYVEAKGATVTVAFDEYTPVALWCKTKEDTSCVFIDVHGFAFAQAPVLQGSAFVRFIDEGKEPLLKTVGFDESFIGQSNVFTEKLQQELGLYVTHVVKKGNYDMEFTLSGGGVLKVSQTESLETTFKNLKTVLDSKQFENLEPGSFQYIDLRFGDKIFVNDAIPGSATTTASSTSQVQ